MKSIDRILLVLSIVTGTVSIVAFTELLFMSSDILRHSIKDCQEDSEIKE